MASSGKVSWPEVHYMEVYDSATRADVNHSTAVPPIITQAGWSYLHTNTPILGENQAIARLPWLSNICYHLEAMLFGLRLWIRDEGEFGWFCPHLSSDWSLYCISLVDKCYIMGGYILYQHQKVNIFLLMTLDWFNDTTKILQKILSEHA